MSLHNIERGILLEVFVILRDLTLVVLDVLLHLGLELLITLCDDCISVHHTLKELLVLVIDVGEIVFVLLRQLNHPDLTVGIVHDEFELFLDWFDACLELRILGLDLLVLLSVFLELCSSSARGLELFDSVTKLRKEGIKILLALGDEMTENLSYEGVAVVDEVVFHLRGVENDELLVLLDSLQSDIIHDVLQVFYTLFVPANRVILGSV